MPSQVFRLLELESEESELDESLLLLLWLLDPELEPLLLPELPLLLDEPELDPELEPLLLLEEDELLLLLLLLDLLLFLLLLLELSELGLLLDPLEPLELDPLEPEPELLLLELDELWQWAAHSASVL